MARTMFPLMIRRQLTRPTATPAMPPSQQSLRRLVQSLHCISTRDAIPRSSASALDRPARTLPRLWTGRPLTAGVPNRFLGAARLISVGLLFQRHLNVQQTRQGNCSPAVTTRKRSPHKP